MVANLSLELEARCPNRSPINPHFKLHTRLVSLWYLLSYLLQATARQGLARPLEWSQHVSWPRHFCGTAWSDSPRPAGSLFFLATKKRRNLRTFRARIGLFMLKEGGIWERERLGVSSTFSNLRLINLLQACWLWELTRRICLPDYFRPRAKSCQRAKPQLVQLQMVDTTCWPCRAIAVSI